MPSLNLKPQSYVSSALHMTWNLGGETAYEMAVPKASLGLFGLIHHAISKHLSTLGGASEGATSKGADEKTDTEAT